MAPDIRLECNSTSTKLNNLKKPSGIVPLIPFPARETDDRFFSVVKLDGIVVSFKLFQETLHLLIPIGISSRAKAVNKFSLISSDSIVFKMFRELNYLIGEINGDMGELNTQIMTILLT